MALMREELEQVVPTISQNPFLKNDQKRLGKLKSVLPSSCVKEQESSDETKERIVVEREHSAQRDILKQELDHVLKGIKDTEDTCIKDINDEPLENVADKISDIDITSTDNEDCADVSLEENDSTEKDISERSPSRVSESSDVTIALEDDIEKEEDIGENTEEEISAL